ncbi:MAG: hypothetical protein NTZ80_01665 [Patescibacteria group bacterium]|nr:hypothetical protein [Patescibacteria group bacterium]
MAILTLSFLQPYATIALDMPILLNDSAYGIRQTTAILNNNDASGSVKLQFGKTLNKYLEWNSTNTTFVFNGKITLGDDLALSGHNITGTGTYQAGAIADTYISSAATWSGKYGPDGTDVAVADGGTGKSSWTQYAIPYASTTTAFSNLAIGSASQYLQVNAGANGYQWDSLTNADVGLGSVENTALSTWAGTTNITTVGALTLGGNMNLNGKTLTSSTGAYLTIGSSAGHDFNVGAGKLVVEGDTSNVYLSSANIYSESSGQLNCTTLNTGQGDYELYSMNQNVTTTSSPTFDKVYLSDYGYALGGFHVGGTSDPGTDNLVVDGNADITGTLTVGNVCGVPSAAILDQDTNIGAAGTRMTNFEVTSLGYSVACAGTAKSISGQCVTADGSNYLKMEVRVNGVAQVCDTPTINSANTGFSTTGCAVSFAQNDLIGCYVVSKTGTPANCTCSIFVQFT